MKADDELYGDIEDAMEYVRNLFDDTDYSQEQSVEGYEAVAGECRDHARLIRSEMPDV